MKIGAFADSDNRDEINAITVSLEEVQELVSFFYRNPSVFTGQVVM